MANNYLESFFLFIGVVVLASFTTSCSKEDKTEVSNKPNVILIMTDDQGIGDFGFTGNPYIKTPVLDKLAEQSLNLTNFYVSPVCAPTRASLMTGRFSERTGVYDTYNGGATMSSNEITIAELMKENGYQTGIFGKWHLGDNYPYRPIDQGFNEALVHRGGGVGQPGDVMNYFFGDSSYFNPVLFKNGNPVQTIGYCSDVYTNELIDFIKNNQKSGDAKPFFAYLSFNAPHTPLQLPEEYYNRYKDVEFDANEFEVYDEAVPKMKPREIEDAKKVYGMVTNIDDNIGKVLQTIKDEDVYSNTIIIFLTDNGPQQNRYKCGLRERKSSVFGGGVRVPCLIHYPKKFKEKSEIDATFAHIDLLPSILDLCGVKQPNHNIDGISIFSSENEDYSAFENRTLFFEWGRGFLKKYRNFSALKDNFKLVGNTGQKSGIDAFELLDVKNDPQEKNNILKENIEKAKALKQEMDDWYDEIVAEENNNKSFPAYIGTQYENPVILNRNDAKGTPVAWGQDNVLGYWDVKAPEDGFYNISYHFIKPVTGPGKAILKMYPYNLEEACSLTDLSEWTFKNIKIKKGEYRFEPYFQTTKQQCIFPLYVSVERIDK
ncbi:arylsulfatase [uncultured Draconibacterium sp.]|uniref:arylsulfatase n=1 Tax=uncultured Draconibacterium sp. TaxID=1573823 RepID=UPI0029C94683|nr:arylsulfatase [uncultured Draconibacterium sp.]